MTEPNWGNPSYSRTQYRKHMDRERRKLEKGWLLRSSSFDAFLAVVEAAIGFPPTLLHAIALPIAGASELNEDFEPTFDRIAWWSVSGGWTCGRPLGDRGARCAEVFSNDSDLVQHRSDKHGG